MKNTARIYRYFILTLLCLFSLAGKADGIEFDSYSWDFGQIQEADGVVSHTFVLTNKTSADLLITSAIPSCSCTLVTYPKETIHPGEKGEIEVSYTPSGAMGKVFREVQLYDYHNKTIGLLEISADVVPADRSIPERYPFALAHSLYANINAVPFGYVYQGTQKSKIIYLANASDKPMSLRFSHSCDKLTLRYPDTLQPGEEAELEMTFRTPADPEYFAWVMDTLRLQVNGEPALMPIVVSMIALAKIDTLAEVPVLRSYPSDPRLKRKGKTFTTRVELSNDGQAPLTLRALQLPDGTSANIQRGEVIAQGKKRILEIQSQRNENFTLRLFSDDPTRPMKEIRVGSLSR